MSAIETQKDFQTRMFEQIRAQMGDLLTQEELKKIVDEALYKAFFEERKVTKGYSYETRTEPSFFVEMLRDELRDQVKSAAAAYLQEHPDYLRDALDTLLAKGFMTWVLEYLNVKLQPSVQSWVMQMKSSNLI